MQVMVMSGIIFGDKDGIIKVSIGWGGDAVGCVGGEGVISAWALSLGSICWVPIVGW